MLNLISSLTTSIRRCFDTRTALDIIANDRNLLLVGFDDKWIVLDGSGSIVAQSNTQTSALTIAIFGAK